MSYAPAWLKHQQYSQMQPAGHFLLELDRFMDDLRRTANQIKRDAWRRSEYGAPGSRGHLQYLTGHIHGLRFGMWMLLAQDGSTSDPTVDYAMEASMAEADFLVDYAFNVERREAADFALQLAGAAS